MLINSFKEAHAEKHGKRIWVSRYLVLVVCQLFIYRYLIVIKKGDQNIPLNVIDVSEAQIDQKTQSIISITTHREVIGFLLMKCNVFRIGFSEILSWMVELKTASVRGLFVSMAGNQPTLCNDSRGTGISFIELTLF